MNTEEKFDWNLFLKEWSEKSIECLDNKDIESLSSETINNKWLGYIGATEDEVSETETRLNINLPSSYRDFLKVSNGWQKLDDTESKLLSTQEIEWLISKNEELIDGWKTGAEIEGEIYEVLDEEYFIYGDEQDTTSIRLQYLEDLLEIGGDPNEGLLLLNPKVIFEDGEWEAWFLASWLAGAERYKSFKELMQNKYQAFLD